MSHTRCERNRSGYEQDVGWRPFLVVPLLAAAACGGGASASSGTRTHTAEIPAAVAAALATRADAAAADLRDGRGCAARQEAYRLREEVKAAVRAGRIPSRLQAELASAVASLSARIVCTPPLPTSKADEKPAAHEDKPARHEHHHHKQHGKDGEGG